MGTLLLVAFSRWSNRARKKLCRRTETLANPTAVKRPSPVAGSIDRAINLLFQVKPSLTQNKAGGHGGAATTQNYSLFPFALQTKTATVGDTQTP